MDVVNLPRTRAGANLRDGTVVTLLAVALVAASRGEWASAELAGNGGSVTLLDAPLAAGALALAAVAIAVGGVGTVLGFANGRRLATTAAGVVTVVTLVFIGVAEMAASVVPDRALPATASRYALGSGAGLGAFAALLSAGGALVAASATARRRVIGFVERVRSYGGLALAAVAILVVAGVVLFELRQEPWLESTAADPDATTLPLVAPATLLAVLVIGLAIGAVGSGLVGIGALLAVGCGGVVTLCAATVISLGELLTSLEVDVDVVATGAVWSTLLLGLVVVAAGAVLLKRGSSSLPTEVIDVARCIDSGYTYEPDLSPETGEARDWARP